MSGCATASATFVHTSGMAAVPGVTVVKPEPNAASVMGKVPATACEAGLPSPLLIVTAEKKQTNSDNNNNNNK